MRLVLDGGTYAMDVVLGVVSFVLLLAALTKCWAVAAAIRWASSPADSSSRSSSHAILYSVENGALQEEDIDRDELRQRRDELLQKHGGNFLPFGAKDYRLRQLWSGPNQHPSPLVRNVVRAAANVLFTGRRLIWLSFGIIAVGGSVGLPAGSLTLWIQVVLGLGVVTFALLVIFESVVWYVLVGAYAGPFHGMGSWGRGGMPGDIALVEIKVFAKTVMLSIVAWIGAASAAQMALGGQDQSGESLGAFAGLDASGNPGGQGRRVASLLFYALSTLSTVDGSSVKASSWLANLLGSILVVVTLLLVLFALAVVVPLLIADGRMAGLNEVRVVDADESAGASSASAASQTYVPPSAGGQQASEDGSTTS